MSNNHLKEIGSRAFARSKIENLSVPSPLSIHFRELNDNRELDKIASDAFSEVAVLHKL